MNDKTNQINVLYIHPAASFGGASKSLLELIKAFPKDSINGVVICPKGQVANVFSDIGLKTITLPGLMQWDNTRYGYYRGLRWIIVLREIFLFPFALYGIIKAKHICQFDIIHINEVTLLLVGAIARRIIKAPLVVHVRSLQRSNDKNWRTKHFNSILRAEANAIVAIDCSVRNTLPLDLPVTIIHNGINIDFRSKINGSDHSRPLRVGIVGGLLKLKGVYEYIEAARILIQNDLDIVFTIVGDNARKLKGFKGWLLMKLNFAHDVQKDIENYIEKYKLNKRVFLKGFVKDVQKIYSELDVLCFPSHLDSAGRPVFESAFYSVPSIVAVKNPEPDTIVAGETGLCIDTPDSNKLANAILYMYNNPIERRNMGKNARILAEKNFDINKNARRILSLYQSLLISN